MCMCRGFKRYCATAWLGVHSPEQLSETRGRMRPAGVSRGEDTHVGTSAFRARQAREDDGWDGATRRAPRLVCPRVILPPSHCEVTRRQKCALFFLSVESLRGDRDCAAPFPTACRGGSG